jgi:hypothetical protein
MLQEESQALYRWFVHSFVVQRWIPSCATNNTVEITPHSVFHGDVGTENEFTLTNNKKKNESFGNKVARMYRYEEKVIFMKSNAL